jgi:nucleoside-diphosphate kinase
MKIESFDDAFTAIHGATERVNDVIRVAAPFELVGATRELLSASRDSLYLAADAIRRESLQTATCANCKNSSQRHLWRTHMGDMRCPTCGESEREQRRLAESTFAMVKPDAITSSYLGRILSRIEEEGFTIDHMEKIQLSKPVVRLLYSEHVERSFWPNLLDFTLSSPVVLLQLTRENAVAYWRKVLGATDPRDAEPGTLRHAFGNKKGIVYRNVAHGSDSVASAKRELAIFWV